MFLLFLVLDGSTNRTASGHRGVRDVQGQAPIQLKTV